MNEKTFPLRGGGEGEVHLKMIVQVSRINTKALEEIGSEVDDENNLPGRHRKPSFFGNVYGYGVSSWPTRQMIEFFVFRFSFFDFCNFLTSRESSTPHSPGLPLIMMDDY